jgi:hypothetical protein
MNQSPGPRPLSLLFRVICSRFSYLLPISRCVRPGSRAESGRRESLR